MREQIKEINDIFFHKDNRILERNPLELFKKRDTYVNTKTNVRVEIYTKSNMYIFVGYNDMVIRYQLFDRSTGLKVTVDSLEELLYELDD